MRPGSHKVSVAGRAGGRGRRLRGVRCPGASRADRTGLPAPGQTGRGHLIFHPRPQGRAGRSCAAPPRGPEKMGAPELPPGRGWARGGVGAHSPRAAFARGATDRERPLSPPRLPGSHQPSQALAVGGVLGSAGASGY